MGSTTGKSISYSNSQLPENNNKRGRKGCKDPGNCFEANLIHLGGPGYLKAAQKCS